MSDQTPPAGPPPEPPADANPVQPAAPATPPPPPPASAPPPPPPPGAFPASAAWGSGAAPVAPTKRNTGLILAIVVAAILAIAGGLATINASRSSASTPGEPGVPVPGPTVDPTAGPTQQATETTETLPGPKPPPTVTTTIPPPPTQPTTSIPPPSGGNTVPVFGSLTVTVPDGWDVLSSTNGLVVLETSAGDAQFEVAARASDGTDDAATVLNSFMSGVIDDQVDDVQIENQSSTPLPSASAVSGESLTYTGVLASQQGSIPVEGVVFAFVLQDGTELVMDTFNMQGDFDSFSADYSTMLGSVLASA